MTCLKDEGYKGVSKWTSKKNINIFEKKLLFMPVHESLHWSLCIVVNPDLIVNNRNASRGKDEECAWWVFNNSFLFILDFNAFYSFSFVDMLVSCTWIHWIITTKRSMQNAFSSGWTLNGKDSAKESSTALKLLSTRIVCRWVHQRVSLLLENPTALLIIYLLTIDYLSSYSLFPSPYAK